MSLFISRDSISRAWMACASGVLRVPALDFFLSALAVYLGYALRLSLIIPNSFFTSLIAAAIIFPICTLASFSLFGVYKVHWPQAGVADHMRLARGYFVSSAVFIALCYLVPIIRVPRTSLAISIMSGFIFTASMRASWRLLELSASRANDKSISLRNALIIGAGEAGAYIANDLTRRASGLRPVGFIDDDPQKRGRIIAGIPVIGSDEDMRSAVERMNIKTALIAIPSASGANVRKYLDTLSSLGVEVRVLPSLRELAGSKVAVSSMRHVQLQDLLRREPITLDKDGIDSVIQGKVVLITGAGGSIGSELCAQISRHSPSKMILLGHGEGSIYNVLQKLREDEVETPLVPVIADTADLTAMKRVYEMHKPAIVFHAAAHKHVPLMEDAPREALRVNALGTYITAQLAGEYKAERFVMISTDKAVHPSSVMGATKRIAEHMLKTAQNDHKDTAYMAVRFGNVLGSRGSVVPLFERQISRGGPVTVTHPDMTRYFMLIPEAVSLVLQAASMGRAGDLFVLDMGEPVNITDMAETLIRLHGHVPGQDIKIVFTGIRPGEKLNEELFYDLATVDKTAHDKIFRSTLGEVDSGSYRRMQDALFASLSDEEMRRTVFELANGSL